MSNPPPPSRPRLPDTPAQRSPFHLAQINTARLRAPLDSPSMSGFTGRLDPIHALADRSPGFVWRLVDEEGKDATGLRPFGEDLLVNLSVWEDVRSLWEFTYRTEHLELLRQRRSWFARSVSANLALWWIPAGTVPSLAEGGERLETLRERGPTPEAFTLRQAFDPPAAPRGSHS